MEFLYGLAQMIFCRQHVADAAEHELESGFGVGVEREQVVAADAYAPGCAADLQGEPRVALRVDGCGCRAVLLGEESS
jgi:hypothetical protein